MSKLGAQHWQRGPQFEGGIHLPCWVCLPELLSCRDKMGEVALRGWLQVQQLRWLGQAALRKTHLSALAAPEA